MIVFTELFEGRYETEGVRRVARIPYLATSLIGDVEESVITQYAFANLPSLYNGLILATVEVEEHVSADRWRIIAIYEQYDSIFSFDTGGGTQHITNSIATRNRYAPTGATAPDFKGAIGYDGQNVAGVDVVVPVYHFSETHYMPDVQVSGAYKAKVFELTGCVNNDPFRGFSPGEVLFLGAAGTKRGTDYWELQFRFASLPNKTDIVIGDITVAEKKGWDYMWILYEDAEDTSAKKLVKRPLAVYVEKVYEDKSFADLMLG